MFSRKRSEWRVVVILAVLTVAGGAASAGGSLQPGTFGFDTAAPGQFVISQSKLEQEVCGIQGIQSVTVGELSAISAPTEIKDINANFDIQGMMAPTSSNPFVTSPFQVHVEVATDFDGNNESLADVRPARYCMESVAPVSLSCGDWDVTVRLDTSASPPASTLRIIRQDTDGGVFLGDVSVDLELVFERPQFNEKVFVDHSVVYSASGRWAYEPGKDGAELATPFQTDSDCDDQGDTTVLGSSNFFPGWSSSGIATEANFMDMQSGGFLRLNPPTK